MLSNMNYDLRACLVRKFFLEGVSFALNIKTHRKSKREDSANSPRIWRREKNIVVVILRQWRRRHLHSHSRLRFNFLSLQHSPTGEFSLLILESFLLSPPISLVASHSSRLVLVINHFVLLLLLSYMNSFSAILSVSNI